MGSAILRKTLTLHNGDVAKRKWLFEGNFVTDPPPGFREPESVPARITRKRHRGDRGGDRRDQNKESSSSGPAVNPYSTTATQTYPVIEPSRVKKKEEQKSRSKSRSPSRKRRRRRSSRSRSRDRSRRRRRRKDRSASVSEERPSRKRRRRRRRESEEEPQLNLEQLQQLLRLQAILPQLLAAQQV